MKKKTMAIAVGGIVLALSACGQKKSVADEPIDITDSLAERSAAASEEKDVVNEPVGITDSLAEHSTAASEVQEKSEPLSDTGNIDAVLESLTGEYEYSSDTETGRLFIQKSSYGYDISDYVSDAPYRFLADSSNIETIDNNRIHIKYPEQVFSDGGAVFGYYILEYDQEGIDVYYGKTASEDAEFLYHATKKTETYGYEGTYLDYSVNEPALEIKKNSDGTYQVQIDLFRLYLLDDGIGKETENGLEFTATGPGPGETKVNGVITLEGSIATVTILGQEWLDFAGLSEYKFYRTFDVPDDTDVEKTAEELFDLFINGSVNAADSSGSEFSINDLDQDAYSVGEQADLDNDGEDELVINGPYGGMYLDARDNKVYKFAEGDGTAVVLSYTYYNGAVWIMYSNQSSAGFEYYHMEKYEGADHLAAEMNFGEEFDVNNAEAGVKYTWNEREISSEEYTALCSKIFAAQVSTD